MDNQQITNKNTLYLAFAIIAAIIGAVVMLYVASYPSVPPYTTWPVRTTNTVAQTAAEQSQLPPLSGGTTTSNITNDLNQIPDDSAALNQDLNTLNNDIRGF